MLTRSPARGRSPISTAENATEGTAEKANRLSAEDGPATDTPAPRATSPVASILTCAPVPPAAVPRISVTRSGGSAPVPFTPLPRARSRGGTGAEAGQGGAQVAAVEAEHDRGEHGGDHEGHEHGKTDVGQELAGQQTGHRAGDDR